MNCTLPVFVKTFINTCFGFLIIKLTDAIAKRQKGMRMKISALINVIMVCLFMTTPAYSDEVPLENPSFAEGAKAIRDMHGLNLLGLGGDLITIFIAANEASKAAEIFYQNKWRPGDDDLGWVDKQRTDRKPDPLAGLTRDDRKKWDDRWEKIKYLQGLVTPNSTASEKEEISQAIRGQFSHLNRIIANYRDIVEQVGFVGTHNIAASGNFAGRWQTKWGIVTIENNGSGSYPHDNGKITVTEITGRILKGTWKEDPSSEPSKDSGELKFTLKEDGNSWRGEWRYGTSGNWNTDWDGTRLE